mgnify:CR=1 FL=1
MDDSISLEDWMDENEYTHVGGAESEFFECPGGHIWFIADIINLYEESVGCPNGGLLSPVVLPGFALLPEPGKALPAFHRN